MSFDCTRLCRVSEGSASEKSSRNDPLIAVVPRDEENHSYGCPHDGDEFLRHLFNKLVTRVGFLNVIRENLVIAKTTTEDLVARLSKGFASVMTPRLAAA